MRGREDGAVNPLRKAVESAQRNATAIQRQPNSTISNSNTAIPVINVTAEKRWILTAKEAPFVDSKNHHHKFK